MVRRRLLALAVVSALAVACYPKSAPPPQKVTSGDVMLAQGEWPDATEAQLNHGKDLFVARCNQCHDYPAMNAESPKAWPRTLDKMATKAKLAPAEKQAVLRFILTEESHSSWGSEL